MASDQHRYQMAVEDFHLARQKAAVQEILGRLTGKSTSLLSYDEVAEKLRLNVRTDRGVQSIPIDAIVGSVGRYSDFTRTFLPRRSGGKERWARVKAAADEGSGLPPIEVYKVGEAYFVIDGNHRVSVARQERLKTIEAHVIEVQSDVPLSPNVQPDEMIIKAEYAEFLNRTRLADLRPNVDLTVTTPGQYNTLMSQIYMQKFLMEEDSKVDISFEQAVAAWYDHAYTSLTEIIRDRGLLHWFPGRTLTDLYVWISENRRSLEKELGVEIQSDVAATDLILDRQARDQPGEWRRARTVTRYTDRLFSDILVPLSGAEESWDALDQAVIIAQHEGARLHGMHIGSPDAKLESEEALAIQERFGERCASAEVTGRLVLEQGNITDKILERAVMTDLIVLKVLHPPAAGLTSITSSIRSLIVNASRPILAVPAQASAMKRAVLAFDGSPRAREALFVAAYLAETWRTELVVWSRLEGARVKAEVQDYVRRYLEIHEVEAEYVLSHGTNGASLLDVGREGDIDLVLMGGYVGPLVREIVVGSMVDTVLRTSTIPTFVCR